MALRIGRGGQGQQSMAVGVHGERKPTTRSVNVPEVVVQQCTACRRLFRGRFHPHHEDHEDLRGLWLPCSTDEFMHVLSLWCWVFSSWEVWILRCQEMGCGAPHCVSPEPWRRKLDLIGLAPHHYSSITLYSSSLYWYTSWDYSPLNYLPRYFFSMGF